VRITCLLLLSVLTVRAADELIPLSPGQVRAGGEIGRRVEITIRNNLLALDAEKDFLAPFQARNQRGGYIGLGKLLMAAARFAASTGDAAAVRFERDLASRVAALQEADGYLGLCAPASRVHALWDVHELGYLIAGLLDDYQYFQRARSLEAARKAADYLLAHWSEVPPDWGQRTGVATHVAVTGIERTLLALHRVTGEARYLNFVLHQRALAEWDFPIIIGRRAGIEGHIYAFLARSLAQLELHRLRPAPELLRTSDRALGFLTRQDGMAVTGAAGQWEIWTNDQDGRGALGETCATAYELRWLDSLLRLRGEARPGDLMERIIYNTLFAAQSPDGRRIRYYAPLEGPREYHPGDTYCCPGNYRRIIAELPEMIYYRWGNGLAVNLLTASEARLEAGGALLRVRQRTAYPSSGTVDLLLDPERPARFPLRVRIPAWAAGARALLNGEAAGEAAEAGQWLTLNRTWSTGDVLRLEFPLHPRMVRGRQRQAGRAAVLAGPLVLTLNPARDGALAGLDGADLGRYTIDPASLELLPDASVRPGGMAVRAGAWKPGHSLVAKPELHFVLTEFADPGGRAVYFRLRDPAQSSEDELLGLPSPR
jgi:DUF1680 family protein